MPRVKGRKDKDVPAPDFRVCANCFEHEESKTSSKFSACARCSLVLYCSTVCQRAHWKANHKQYCIEKEKRAPQIHDNDYKADSPRVAAASKNNCCICLEQLKISSVFAFPCTHVFHSSCAAELRKFGVQKVCPLCRTALPPGPEKLYARRYALITSMVTRGGASWTILSSSTQLELEALVAD